MNGSKSAESAAPADGPLHNSDGTPVVLGEARAERLARAHGYPYPYPEHSYLYLDGVPVPLRMTGTEPFAGEVEVDAEWMPVSEHLDRLGIRDAALRPRTSVLAYGSNRSPSQLERKYGHWREPVVIPVAHGWLRGFDVVYAARLAGYGSVAATIAPAPHTVCEVSVLWLDEAQLDLMHVTEGLAQSVYGYGVLEDIELTLDGGGRLDRVHTYVNLDGALVHKGSAVALATVKAEGRAIPALDQLSILGRVRDRIEPDADLESFVLEHIEDEAVRDARCRVLREDAWKFEHPSFTRLAP